MHLCSCTQVEASDCGMGTAGAKAFGDVLRVNKTLQHLNVSNNSRTAAEHLLNILEHLSDIYGRLSSICRASIENLSITYRTSIEHPSDGHWKHTEHLSKPWASEFYRESMEQLPRSNRMSIGEGSKPYRACIQHVWRMCRKPIC